MFEWLFPSSCPLEPDERAWVDARVAWILRSYPHLVEFPVRLPLRSDFPDAYDGTRDAACALFRRIQTYAQARGETKPPWRKHLSADPRAYFEQSCRFLRREPPLSLLP